MRYDFVISAITTRSVIADSEDEAFERVYDMEIEYGEFDDPAFEIVSSYEGEEE